MAEDDDPRPWSSEWPEDDPEAGIWDPAAKRDRGIRIAIGILAAVAGVLLVWGLVIAQ